MQNPGRRRVAGLQSGGKEERDSEKRKALWRFACWIPLIVVLYVTLLWSLCWNFQTNCSITRENAISGCIRPDYSLLTNKYSRKFVVYFLRCILGAVWPLVYVEGAV